MTFRLLIAAIAMGGAVAAYRAIELGRTPLPALPRIGEIASPGPEAALEPARLARAELMQFRHLFEHPPFAPDRRPYPAATGDPADTAGPKDADRPFEATLLGVITDAGERFAILALRNTATTEIVRRGGEIDGWIVKKIDDNRVILRKGALEVEILLFEGQ
jgi:hypothetical protein